MINKVTITNGAKYDYERIVAMMPLNLLQMKKRVESRLAGNENDVRMVYFDEESNLNLMLYLRKSYLFGTMQTWILQGISLAEDYSTELEESGLIREWLEVEIDDVE